MISARVRRIDKYIARMKFLRGGVGLVLHLQDLPQIHQLLFWCEYLHHLKMMLAKLVHQQNELII